MSLMHCPSCGTNFGGPTMEAFGCCPLCFADHQRVERFVRLDDEDTAGVVAAGMRVPDALPEQDAATGLPSWPASTLTA